MAVIISCRSGHDYPFTERQGLGCPTCGDGGVSNVSAPPPRFVGTVSGPYASTHGLAAIAVDLAPGGHLPLKEIPHG